MAWSGACIASHLRRINRARASVGIAYGFKLGGSRRQLSMGIETLRRAVNLFVAVGARPWVSPMEWRTRYMSIISVLSLLRFILLVLLSTNGLLYTCHSGLLKVSFG
jgi:hypothetical protein